MPDDDKPGPTSEFRQHHEIERSKVLVTDPDTGRSKAPEIYRVKDQTRLDWCHRRGYISERQYRAGCNLREDWHQARYDPVPPPPLDRVPGTGGGSEPAGVWDARDRVAKALQAIGLTLAPVAVRIVIVGDEFGALNRDYDWRDTTARAMLQMALDALVDHYPEI